MLSSVDLPQPDGPITATNSPCADCRVGAAQRPHRCGLLLERSVHRPHLDGVRRDRPVGLGRRLTAGHRSLLGGRRTVAFGRRVRSVTRHAPESPVPSPAVGSSFSASPAVRSSCSHVGSLSDGLAGGGELLQPLAEVHGVADDRVLDPLLAEPSSAAATSPVLTGRCRGRTASGPRRSSAALTSRLGGVHRTRRRRAPGRRDRRTAPGRRTPPSPHRPRTASPSHRDRGWRGSSRRGAG